ncbi:MAG: contact-dependent growth inhibition system immunity protein [Acidobacteriota bacterium]
MNEDSLHSITFEEIERGKGFASPLPRTSDDEYPLPAWYRSVRSKPLRDFTIEDLCRSCRENIHLEHIVPLCLSKLAKEPMSGELYDGELLVALRSVPTSYWANNSDQRTRLVKIIEGAIESMDEQDLQNEMDAFLVFLSPHAK